MQMCNPAHPGEVLNEAYLDPLSMSGAEFARRIGRSRKCASDCVNKHAGTSVVTAHRPAKTTGTTAESWLPIQAKFLFWQGKQIKVFEHMHVQRLPWGIREFLPRTLLRITH